MQEETNPSVTIEVSEERYTYMRNWYRNLEHIFLMFPYFKNREMACLVPSWLNKDKTHQYSNRMMKVQRAQDIGFNIFKRMQLQQKNRLFNIYHSVAQYNEGIPHQKFLFVDNFEQNHQWKQDHWKSMHKYDFVIDIDSPSHEDIHYAHQSAINLHEFFNDLEVPHTVNFSGMGFHFTIAYHLLPKSLHFNPEQEGNIYDWCYQQAKKLNQHISQLIDLKIYDARRVIKTPYTLALYEDDMYMCSPLSSLHDWSLTQMLAKHIDLAKQRPVTFNATGDLDLFHRQMAEW